MAPPVLSSRENAVGADPLISCLVPSTPGAAPTYYLAGVIAIIEGLDPVQAGNRWSHLKSKCPTAETSRVSGKNTVDEASLIIILPLMKNTDQKRAAMTARGMAVVREIVFQGLDGLPVRIEVNNHPLPPLIVPFLYTWRIPLCLQRDVQE